jgi:hypothetical protein
MWLIVAVAFMLLAFALSFFAGYMLRDVKDKLKALGESIKSIKTVAPEPEKPNDMSRLLDPDDIVARAKWEHDEMMRKINK